MRRELEAVVSRAYWQLLDRSPDPEGAALHLKLLYEGAVEDELREAIANSPEARVRRAALAGSERTVVGDVSVPWHLQRQEAAVRLVVGVPGLAAAEGAPYAPYIAAGAELGHSLVLGHDGPPPASAAELSAWAAVAAVIVRSTAAELGVSLADTIVYGHSFAGTKALLVGLEAGVGSVVTGAPMVRVGTWVLALHAHAWERPLILPVWEYFRDRSGVAQSAEERARLDSLLPHAMASAGQPVRWVVLTAPTDLFHNDVRHLVRRVARAGGPVTAMVRLGSFARHGDVEPEFFALLRDVAVSSSGVPDDLQDALNAQSIPEGPEVLPLSQLLELSEDLARLPTGEPGSVRTVDLTSVHQLLAERPSGPHPQDWMGNRWPRGSSHTALRSGPIIPRLPRWGDGCTPGDVEWTALALGLRWAQMDLRPPTAVELRGGAGGPWALAWVRGARKLGLVGEVRATAYGTAVSTPATVAWWTEQDVNPRVGKVRGGLALRGDGWTVTLRRRVRCWPARSNELRSALRHHGHVHLFHLGAHDAEADLADLRAIAGSGDRVGVVVLRTGSRVVEGLAIEILHAGGFLLLQEAPCRYALGNGRPVPALNGAQLWVSGFATNALREAGVVNGGG